MTRNLDLPGGTTITSSDSNITAASYDLPASSTSGFTDSTAAYVYNSGNTICDKNQPCYSYYSYAAATAGINPSSNSAASDICPKGWRLPTDAEYTSLKNTYSSMRAFYKPPFLGHGSGYFYTNNGFGGAYGYFWSSTAYSASDAYYLTYGPMSSASVGNLKKSYGCSIRCVKSS
jgi:hypothetical protein